MSDYYPPRTRVLVVPPGDPFTRLVGTVERTFNDGGDMVHRVQFSDGNSAYYLADELRDARRAT